MGKHLKIFLVLQLENILNLMMAEILWILQYCTYQNVEVKAKQQFILNIDAGTFEAGALYFNDVPQNALITASMLSKAFESDSATTLEVQPTTAQDTQSTTTSTKENADDPYEWAPGIKAKLKMIL
ncbi:hypothetical protein K9O30_15790 [Clostridium bowmanii]|uniref:hypothetical protein n=1 Tax=Clostridium bowmanii TaxID=132925 RepID=UPI001C0E7B7C|nr:hypothetical protein [Clostridium bowmanii]MBU3190933.1 hypothetical protein [Clostridium bowmanii]MCA1075161.1 hypothetical protein [Clostridium bowmanii]